MKEVDIERREYFRIRDRIPISYRKLSEKEAMNLKKLIRYSSSANIEDFKGLGSIIEKIHKKIGEEDELFLFLSMIDKKLDRIMEYIMTQKRENDTEEIKYHDVEISGSGMKFYPELESDVGDLLEFKIILPIFGFPKIYAIGRVQRTGKEEFDGELKSYIAVKFLEINENDREILIRYLFKRQREMIRAEKEGE